ncbi:10696_t:CDS:2 [Acaulospora colombiana]|uniref:10696_t:CDS:1 n=1 Tax=Acaulospora colombiana TaxID=27376 RepID=A0ACA9KFH2_9GLOM|nr:10696_t:CDS:2 [Acaulospora colombiana]
MNPLFDVKDILEYLLTILLKQWCVTINIICTILIDIYKNF